MLGKDSEKSTDQKPGLVTIEVADGFEEKSGISKKSGNEYRMFLQKAWIHGIDKYPVPVDLAHFERDEVLAPGKYAVTVRHDVRNGRHVCYPEYVPMK